VAAVNSWFSAFVIAGGTSVIFLGPSWRDADQPGTRTSLGIPYRWRVIVGVVLIALAVWWLSDDMPHTSGAVTWFAVLLLTYQAPWLQRHNERPQTS
jgi:hypothetical protein